MVDRQFPEWASFALRPVEQAGWDNRSFRLGDDMVVRLPSAAEYADQVPKEHRWLPYLASKVPVSIPRPLAIGEPMFGYPWQWSIYSWIAGDPAEIGRVADLPQFAADLAGFLGALQSADVTGGPSPGAHNFHRGGPLAIYDSQVRRSISILGGAIDAVSVRATWRDALDCAFDGSDVWVHGDIAAGNLLTRRGRLAAVIDFGSLAVGDPACDLSMAWTFFGGESRDVFLTQCGADQGTVARARGWTLWKGLVVAAGPADTNAIEWQRPLLVIESILNGR
jgi:aminoglycoside phosphotransferase (APT) family kinase protein